MESIKKLVSFILATVCGVSLTVPFETLATEKPNEVIEDSITTSTEQHGTGDLEVSKQQEEEFYASFSQNDEMERSDGTNAIVSLPSSVDLSTSAYFPPIGNQGGYNSCVSWATTYYQFTYEAHKLNNIVTTPANAYSPRWTYNFTNHGCNNGTTYMDAYDVLRYQGAVTMNEAPYDVNNSEFYNWISNEGAMLNALKTKLTNSLDIKLNTAINQITSNTDSDLNALKGKLNEGKVLLIRVICVGKLDNWLFKKTTSNQWAACRAYKTGIDDTDDGHAMVIVGYNDNIQCDVNGNGIIEPSEKGAFKIANSWGSTTAEWEHGNNGYVWVMYDALNKVSANTANNWQAGLPGTRIAIFDRSGGSINAARYITVANQTVNLAAVVNLNTTDCHNVAFNTNRCIGLYTSSSENVARKIAYKNSDTPQTLRSYSGPLVFDFGALDDNIINYLSGYRWYVKLDNKSQNSVATCVSYKIVDDKDVTVKSSNTSNAFVSAGDSRQFYTTLNLQLGDINYSGTLTSDDANLLLSIATGTTDPSHLQTVLGDMNQDGTINIMDVVALNKLLSQNNAISAEEINDMFAQYQEYFRANGIETVSKFYETCSVGEEVQ